MEALFFLGPLIFLVIACVGIPLWLFFDGFIFNFSFHLNSLDDELVLGQIVYTLSQGLLSGFLSTSIALLLAYFVAGFRWPGRGVLFALSSVPFALPSVVVASGFIIMYGRSGHLGQWWGREYSFLYNFGAVTAAHVFFNMPYIFKHLVIATEALPIEYWKTSEILGLNRVKQFRVWIWPSIKNLVASLFLSTSLLCFSSFAIVLILGGNPRQATLEVAIFDMLQSEGEWGGAGVLSLMQIILVLPFIFFLRFFTGKASGSVGNKAISSSALRLNPISDTPLSFRLAGSFLIMVLFIFLAGPLWGIVHDGLRLDFASLPKDVSQKIFLALKNSLMLSLVVAFTTVIVAWISAKGLCLCKAKSQRLFNLIDALLWILMALSPAVLSMAWLYFSISLNLTLGGFLYLILVLIQLMLCLPFMIRMILPAVERLELKLARTSESLSVKGFKKMIWVEWPELKRVFLAAGAVGFSFSLGEIVSLLIFARGQFPTIASLIFEFMGAYKFSLGAFMATLLMVFCWVLTYLSERWLTWKEI